MTAAAVLPLPTPAADTRPPRGEIPPKMVYTGRLTGLMPLLRRELAEALDDVWRYRVMPRGAMVAIKRRPDGRHLVRIARPTRPSGDGALRAWATEVDTFRSHLGIRSWPSIPADSEHGIAVAFLEPARPGTAAAAAGAGTGAEPLTLL